MPGFIGFPEILLLGLVVLLVFGPKRLPEMGRSLGRGLREFKSSVTSDDEKALEVPDAAIAEPVSFAHVNGDAVEPTAGARLETRPVQAEQHVA
jgi:sec-independent protein translocase protein TatA